MADNTEQWINACSICLDPYDNPKILQCFHTFCAKCLEDIITYSGMSGKIYCPLCRTGIQVPQNGVEGFQSNYYIQVSDVTSSPIILCSGETTVHNYINPVPGQTYHAVLSCCEYVKPFKKCVVTVHYITPGKCSPPVLKAKSLGTSVEFTWTGPVDNGGSAIIQYNARMIVPDKGTYEVYNGDIPSCKVDNLNGGRLHLFAVRAQHAAGCGPWSDSLEVITDSCPPADPKELTFDEISSTSVVLFWTEPECNGEEITGYVIAICTKSEKEQLDRTGTNQCTIKICNLNPGTTYTFSVQAVNRIGQGKFCKEMSCTTLASKPSPVTVVKVDVISATSFALCWKEPASNGSKISGYHICLNDCDKIEVSNTRKYRFKKVDTLLLHFISVRAINSVGVSDKGTILAVHGCKECMWHVHSVAGLNQCGKTCELHPMKECQYVKQMNNRPSIINRFAHDRKMSEIQMMHNAMDVARNILIQREMDIIVDEIVTESFGYTKSNMIKIMHSTLLVLAIAICYATCSQKSLGCPCCIAQLIVILLLMTMTLTKLNAKQYYTKKRFKGDLICIPLEIVSKHPTDSEVYAVTFHITCYGCFSISLPIYDRSGSLFFGKNYRSEKQRLKKEMLSKMKQLHSNAHLTIFENIPFPDSPTFVQMYLWCSNMFHYPRHS